MNVSPRLFYLYLNFLLATSIYLYKPVVAALPEFRSLITHDLFINGMVSFFSDTSLLGACLLGMLVIKASAQFAKIKKIGAVINILLVSFVFLCNALHIRYIEHFGTTAKPFLFSNISFDSYLFKIVFSSTYVLAYIGLTITFSVLIFSIVRKTKVTLTTWKQVALLILITVVNHSLFINTRNSSGVHLDIVMNSYSALAHNLQTRHSLQKIKKPEISELRDLRKLFHIKDSSKHGFNGEEYFPLYQKDLEENIHKIHPTNEVYAKLRHYLQEKASKDGPWNVNIVILETGLSEFINYQNPNAPKDLSPSLDRYMKKSILFNQAYAAGRQTKDGQVATLCSIIPASDFHMMIETPRLKSVCLGDIFAGKGYDTYFIYPSDNNFDNQYTFYRSHSINTVIGEEQFDKKLPKSGWGFGDHSLFNKSLETLRKARKPFFSTILTLTHHGPYRLPSDAPKKISDREDLSDRLKVFAYMDWAFGVFMDSFSLEHPHTITVFLSDQGSNLEATHKEAENFEVFQKNLRIPIGIFIPNLPKELQGIKIENMVSALDVAPTLSSLLSYRNLENQFIGKNMFYRNSPIFMREEDSIRKISGIKNEYKTEKVSKDLEHIYMSLFRDNLMFPKMPNGGATISFN